MSSVREHARDARIGLSLVIRDDEFQRGAVARSLQAAACIAGLGLLSYAARTPFLIPPLGATAFLLAVVPEKIPAAPRNVVFGHLIAAAAGWSSLRLLGLHDQQMGLALGCDALHVASASLALAITSFLMIRWRVVHPPAGATALIVGLGLLPHAWQVPLVGASALLLSLEARLLQRASGRSLPWWSAEPAAVRSEMSVDAPHADEASAS
jgi:CBS domain-containing membrane protein